NVPDWREATMQYMVDAFEAPRLFDCHQTVWLFDDTNHGMIARRRRTDPAGIDFREVVANRAVNDSLLNLAQSGNQSLEIRLRRAQDMKRQPLRRLMPDTGQSFQL